MDEEVGMEEGTGTEREAEREGEVKEMGKEDLEEEAEGLGDLEMEDSERAEREPAVEKEKEVGKVAMEEEGESMGHRTLTSLLQVCMLFRSRRLSTYSVLFEDYRNQGGRAGKHLSCLIRTGRCTCLYDESGLAATR